MFVVVCCLLLLVVCCCLLLNVVCRLVLFVVCGLRRRLIVVYVCRFCCLLFVDCWPALRFDVRCLCVVVCWLLLFVVRCSLLVVCRSLCDVCCLLLVVCGDLV